MLKIAITGNIASGKSEVEKIVTSMLYKCIDTDVITHELLANDLIVRKEIISFFGNTVLDENGNISRKALANIVFNDKSKLKELENITHPKITEKVNEFFDNNQKEEIIFVAVPLLYETNTQVLFDKVIFVSAPEEIRLKRLTARNNLSVEEAQKRIQAQLSEKVKINNADYIINNDSDLTCLHQQVKSIIQSLI